MFSDINDDEGLARDLEMTRTQGFDGKTCVHPRQIDRVNACFTPSQKEVKNALRVLMLVVKSSAPRAMAATRGLAAAISWALRTP